MEELQKEDKRKYSKWGAVICLPERDKLLRDIFAAIQSEAKAKGLPYNFHRMGLMLNAAGIPVQPQYIYHQMRGNNNYPFPIEAIIAICKGYGIPLSKIFNPALFESLPESGDK